MAHLLLAIIYLSFISLGLPDGLLGSAWPVMYGRFGVPVSYAGMVSVIIAVGTVISSLMSDRLTLKLGAGRVTALSVAATAVALFGFSVSSAFWMICFWAIPYGLGAGGVDASLNSYVALHYSGRHMSWLHCMWGVGAAVGPYVMGMVLSGGGVWNQGYRIVGLLQMVLTAVLVFSLPLWKKRPGEADSAESAEAMHLRDVVRIPGAKQVMVAFFCYCALEQTAGLWASSYLVLHKGVPGETAAFFGSMFFVGIAVGRGLNGFLTMRFSDTQLIRGGECIIAAGVAAMLLPMGAAVSLLGLMLVGLGCAPIYPCIIHSTPAHFGEKNAQAMIGIQMASAYVGICLMPPLFGWIANNISVSLLPAYLLGILAVMAIMYGKLLKIVNA